MAEVMDLLGDDPIFDGMGSSKSKANKLDEGDEEF